MQAQTSMPHTPSLHTITLPCNYWHAQCPTTMREQLSMCECEKARVNGWGMHPPSQASGSSRSVIMHMHTILLPVILMSG